MTPAFLALSSKAAEVLARCLEIKIPLELKDNLIGPKIKESNYFQLIEGDPTKGICGYELNGMGKKIYRLEHQPTGSNKRYRKVNSVGYGECWEEIS